MNVLVDTSIWSQALRRSPLKNSPVIEELTELIKESRVRIIGPVRQELLSGIKSESQFKELKTYLSAFTDLILQTEDFELAAEYFNRCRRAGIQGSNTDFLICAAASRRNLEIFTADNDFTIYSQHLPVRLYSPRKWL
ncbi:MAG: PIN domain-containing protein [Dehalococcoidales bacterium]|nr:PIN domain-containing protein [Dehalococcoidales bacterium]